EDGIRDDLVTGVQTCALPICRAHAMTLIEMLVAVAVGSLVLMVVAMVFMNGTRAFAAASNYISMDTDSRNTLDHLSQEIRQAGKIGRASCRERDGMEEGRVRL